MWLDNDLLYSVESPSPSSHLSSLVTFKLTASFCLAFPAREEILYRRHLLPCLLTNTPYHHSTLSCLDLLNLQHQTFNMLPISPLRNHDLGNAVHRSPTAESRSKPEARRRLRDQLFRASVSDFNEGLNQTRGNMSPTILDDSDSKSNSPKIDMQAAIALLQELRKTATQEDLVALHRALLPTVDELRPKTSDVASRVEPAIVPLVRRKSLFTPGMATRIESVKNLARSKTTSKDKGSRKGREAAEPAADYFGLKPDAANIRALTPCESDYAQLGMHELGSLRVTNGAATPEHCLSPMISQPPSVASLNEDIHIARPSPPSSMTPTPTMPSMTILDLDAFHHHSSEPTLDVNPEMRIGAAEPISPTQSTRMLPGGPRQPWFTRRLTNDSISSSTSIVRITSSQRMYSTEASSNPFDSSPDHPRTEHDDGIRSAGNVNDTPEAYHDTPHSPLLDDDTSVYSAYPRFTIKPASPTLPTSEVMGSIDEGLVPGPETSNLNVRPQAHSDNHSLRLSVDGSRHGKADSGYGSDTSSKLTAEASGARTINREHLLASGIVTSTGDGLSPSQERDDMSFGKRSMDSEGLPTPGTGTTPERLLQSTSGSSYQFPTTYPESRSEHSTGTSEKFARSIETTSNPTVQAPLKKLMKKRPVSVVALPSAMKQQEDIGILNVPLVPQDMIVRHARRLTLNPGMEHLERTFDSAATSNADDRSVSPVRRVENNIKFPSPESAPVREERGRKSRSPSAEPRSKSRGFFRSKSRKRDESRKSGSPVGGSIDAGCNLAGFAAVAMSLGDSPYALASTGTPQTRPHQTSSSSYGHPHQISSRARSKSIVGMDEKAASEFALMRSRDRIVRETTRDGSPVQSGMNASRTRQDDRIPWPKQRPRPKSMYSDDQAPPVPALPPQSQVAARPRPKSVHVSSFTRVNEAALIKSEESSDALLTYHKHHSYNNRYEDEHFAGIARYTQSQPAELPANDIPTRIPEDWRLQRRSTGEDFHRKLGIYTPSTPSSTHSKPWRQESYPSPVSAQPYPPLPALKLTLNTAHMNPRTDHTTTTTTPPPASSPTRAPSILARAALFERPAANVGPPPTLPPPPPPPLFLENYTKKEQTVTGNGSESCQAPVLMGRWGRG